MDFLTTVLCRILNFGFLELVCLVRVVFSGLEVVTAFSLLCLIGLCSSDGIDVFVLLLSDSQLRHTNESLLMNSRSHKLHFFIAPMMNSLYLVN